MSDQTVHYRIHRIDDSSVLNFLRKLKQIGGADLPFEQKVGISQYIMMEPAEFSEISTGVGKFIIQTATSNFGFGDGRAVSISFRRSVHTNNKLVASASWDEVSYLISGSIDRWEPLLPSIMSIIELISTLDVATDPQTLSGEMPDTLHETLRSMNATHAMMMDGLNRALIDLANKRTEMEQDFVEKEAARKEEFDRTKAELESERSALDKLSSRSARRRVSQRIEDMAKEFGESRRTFSSRTHGFGIAVGMVALTAATYFSVISYNSISVYSDMIVQIENLNQNWAQSEDSDANQAVVNLVNDLNIASWFLMLKSLASGVISAGAFTYSATWLKRYYQEDLAQAQELQRLNADVARASWVVEAIHEIQDEAKAELPPAWVEAVTRNLFSHENARSQVDDAALALRALMGFSAGAKIGPNGAEIEIGKKGAKALSQAEA
jgi:hypothetical protein